MNQPDERALLRRPCTGCPYARTTPRGQLRGQDVRRFVGQAAGPFLLPFHKWADGEGWPADATRPQCAGAAMYRDLQGYSGYLPTSLLRLTGDASLVFATPAEYVAHHDGCTLEAAEADLRTTTPLDHLRAELADVRACAVPVEREAR